MNLIFSYIILFSLFVSQFCAFPLLANMRAPWVINRYPSYALSKSNNALKVKKESIFFTCDEIYEGSGEFSKIIEKNCKVEVEYIIESKSALELSLEFILPSKNFVITSVNKVVTENIAPESLQISEIQKEGYRLSDLCRFCDKSVNTLYIASFNAKLNKGENNIHILYSQPMSVTEISHGYFQNSKWMNAFEYELWPLKEWELDSNFEMNIKFTTTVGNYWERLFKPKMNIGCKGIDLQFEKIPSTSFKKESGSNGFDKYYGYNQSLNPNYNLSKRNKIYYENDKIVYEVKFNANYPDRVICYFGSDKK